jgi:hypothetical protein
MLMDFNGREFKLGDLVVRSTRCGFHSLRITRIETWLDANGAPQQRIRFDSGGKMQKPNKYIIL